MAISPVPIKRDAFLYMEGPGDKQCGTCWLFSSPRCVVLRQDFEVHSDDSCGYWGFGPKEVQQNVFQYAPTFTPEEVGFVRRAVRCENCYHFDKADSECYLFAELNSKLPELFDLDTKVAPEGCCNAQTPRRSRVVT